MIKCKISYLDFKQLVSCCFVWVFSLISLTGTSQTSETCVVVADQADNGKAWSNTAFADACDDTYTSRNQNAVGNINTLHFTDLGTIDITNGDAINGIIVHVNAYVSSTKWDIATVQLIVGGTPTGTAKTPAQAIATSETDYSFGGGADTWGIGTITEAQVEAADFGVKVVINQNSSGNTTVFIDCVTIDVYHGSAAPILYSVADGNWNATTTWSTVSGGASGAGPPSNAWDVVIEGGFEVEMNQDAADIRNLTVGGTGVGVLDFSSNNRELTVEGNLVILAGSDIIRNGNSNNYLEIEGNININATISSAISTRIVTTGGQNISGTGGIPVLVVNASCTNTGDLTVSNDFSGSANDLLTNLGSFTFTGDGGNFNNTIIADVSGTVTLSPTAAALNIGNVDNRFVNLVVGNGGQSVVVNTPVVIENDLTINAGGVLSNTSNSAISIAGDWLNNNGAGGYLQGTETITFDGTTQTLTNSAGTETFGGMTVSVGTSLTCNDDVATTTTTVTTGILDMLTNRLSGTTLNMSDGTLELGSFTVTQPEFTVYSLTGGTIDFDDATGSTQTIDNAPAGYNNVIFSGGSSGTKQASGALDINGSLTIASATILDMNAQTLNLAGNWTNNNGAAGHVEGNCTMLTFDGGSNTTLDNSSGLEVFNDVTINKSAVNWSVTLNDQLEIKDAGSVLTFTSGRIIGSSGNELVVDYQNGGSHTGVNNNSFAQGPVIFEINSASTYVFPLGETDEYHQTDLIVTGSAGSNVFTVEYVQGAHGQGETRDAAIDHLSKWEYWTFERSGAGDWAAQPVVGYTSDSQVSTGDHGTLQLCQFDNSTSEWEVRQTGGTASPTGTITAAASISSYNRKFWTLGSSAALPTNPLSLSRYSVGDGNWNDNNNWSFTDGGAGGAPFPTSVNIVIINNTQTIDLTATRQCRQLILGSVSAGTLNIATHLLDAGKNGITIASNGDITGSTGTLESDGSVDINNATLTYNTVDLTIKANPSLYFEGNSGSSIGDLVVESAVTNFEFRGTSTFSSITSQASATSTVTGTVNTPTLITGAAMTINGTMNVTSDLQAGANDRITVGAAGTFNYTGNAANWGAGEAVKTNTSGSSFSFGPSAGTLDMDNVTTSKVFTNLSVTAGTVDVGSANITINGDLTISGAGVLDNSGNDIDITILGDWTNYGEAGFVQGAGKVIFNGTSAQEIDISGANGDETFFDLDIDNSSTGVTINGAGAGTKEVYVTNSISLSDGNLITSSTNLFVMANGSTVSLSSVNSFVDGPMKKVGGSAFEFPIGDNGKFRRLKISDFATGSATTEYTAEYLNSDPDVPYDNTSKGAGINNVSYLEYWTLDQAINNDDVKVELYWEDASVSQMTDCPDLTIAHWTGTQWDEEGATASGTCTGAGSGTIISNARVADYSPFTFGSKGAANNPLPVELLWFDAVLEGDEVYINWKTEVEIHNDYFVVERSTDGKNYEPIAIVNGAGYSSIPQFYETLDKNPLPGVSYYRLTQYDFSGNYERFDPVKIWYDAPSLFDPEISIFPNPSDGKSLSVSFEGFESGEEILLVLLGESGQIIYSKVEYLPESGSMMKAMDIREKLAPGIYIVLASANSVYINKKIVVY